LVRIEPLKPTQTNSIAREFSKKRRKSNLPNAPVAVESSRLGLTIVEASQLATDVLMEEHEKFTLVQRDF